MVRKMTPSPERVRVARDLIAEQARKKSKLTFVKELPAIARKRDGAVSGAVEACKGNPGVWALVKRYEGATAGMNSNSMAARLREAGLEAAARGGEVYARWVAHG